MLLKNRILLIFPLFFHVDATFNIRTIQNHTDPNVLHQLEPHDMGALHNTIMTRVHDRIKHRLPASEHHYSAIMYEELSALCVKNDYECKASVHDITVQSKYEVKELFASKRSFDVYAVIPEGFDSDIAKTFDMVYKALWTLESDGVEAYHHELDMILEGMEEKSARSSDFDRAFVGSVVSISKGSGEFWSEVMNNENSILNNGRGRDLQVGGTRVGIFDVVSADVVGALVNSFWAMVYCPLCIFNTLSLAFEIIRGALRGSIGYSLAAMGLIVEFPYATDIVSCVGSNVLENTDLDILKNDDGVVGNLVDVVLRPCDSTSLFGPQLGPIFDDMFPGISAVMEGDADKTENTDETVLTETYESDKNETNGE